MKRPNAVFLVLAALSLVLVGCGGAPMNNALGDPFIGGTGGIVMSFMEQAPPLEIFDAGDSTFSVIVRLQNIGEADVGPDAMTPPGNNWARVEISGVNPMQLGNPQTIKTFSEEGITLTRMRKNFDGSIIAGTPDVMEFDGFRYMPDLAGNTQIKFRANICYDYTTFTNAQVCIKADTLETVRDNTICTLAGPRDIKNSGAPVHVTTLNQAPLGRNKLQFTFTIENVGKGQVFAPTYRPAQQTSGFFSDHCDQSFQNRNRDHVFVTVRLNDEYSTGFIQCNRLGNTNQGLVQLFAGQPTIVTCTLETAQGFSNQAYTDLLRVDLDYAYSEFIEVPVLVRDVSSGLR